MTIYCQVDTRPRIRNASIGVNHPPLHIFMNVDTPSRISFVFSRNPLPATDSFQDAFSLFGINVIVQFLTVLPPLFLLNPDGNFS